MFTGSSGHCAGSRPWWGEGQKLGIREEVTVLVQAGGGGTRLLAVEIMSGWILATI